MLDEIVKTLKNNGIVVIRTDTIYGIIALASSPSAVEKVFKTKKRDANKACIVLIADAASVPKYQNLIYQYSQNSINPTSIIVPKTNEPDWITRGGESVAYRVVRNDLLKQVIKKAGPVIAPSANPEGLSPARNIDEAKAYFDNQVDLYIDGGEVPENIAASNIIEISANGTINKVR